MLATETLPMKSFLCGNCGASLDIPEDPKALDARCSFCDTSTPLPAAILAARARPVGASTDIPAAPSAAGRQQVLLGLGVAVGIGAVTAVLVVSASSSRPNGAPVATSPTAPLPPPVIEGAPPVERPPAPDRRLDDPRASGAEQVSQRMSALYASGCKEVILPPSQTSGTQVLDTKFVLNGRCVTMLASTGAPGNDLTLTMTTPLGAPVPTPPASTSIELSICPTMNGKHPSKIVPRTNDTYTVAAIECPAPSKKKAP